MTSAADARVPPGGQRPSRAVRPETQLRGDRADPLADNFTGTRLIV